MVHWMVYMICKWIFDEPNDWSPFLANHPLSRQKIDGAKKRCKTLGESHYRLGIVTSNAAQIQSGNLGIVWYMKLSISYMCLYKYNPNSFSHIYIYIPSFGSTCMFKAIPTQSKNIPLLRHNMYDGSEEFWVVISEKGKRQESASLEEIHEKTAKACLPYYVILCPWLNFLYVVNKLTHGFKLYIGWPHSFSVRLILTLLSSTKGCSKASVRLTNAKPTRRPWPSPWDPKWNRNMLRSGYNLLTVSYTYSWA